MDPDHSENLDARLRRLLRENEENDPAIVESSQKAIDESRALLERVARDHPDAD